MRKPALFFLFLLANTVSAADWKVDNSREFINNGTLTIRQIDGHFKITFPEQSILRSGSIVVDGDILYVNEPNGFSGIYGDRIIKRLLLAQEAVARYDDRYKTKPSQEVIDLPDLKLKLEQLKK
jgi:hypothetical protein